MYFCRNGLRSPANGRKASKGIHCGITFDRSFPEYGMESGSSAGGNDRRKVLRAGTANDSGRYGLRGRM